MLSDNQRRFRCRIIFLVFCLAPTVALSYWVFHRPTAADWARTIQAELGVETFIESVETPLPGVAVLRGVRLTDPEIGELFETTEVIIEFSETGNRVFIDNNVSLTNVGLIKLVEKLNENPIRRHATDRPWEISFNKLTTVHDRVHDHRLSQYLTVEGLAIRLQPIGDGTELESSFQLVSEPMVVGMEPRSLHRQRVEARLRRSHPNSTGASVLVVELDTKNEQLPCWLLGEMVPEIVSLGPEAQFRGQLEFIPRNNNPHWWVVGNFANVQGSRMSNDRNYDVNVHQCWFDGGIKKWDVELIDNGLRMELPCKYPFNFDRGVIAAFYEEEEAEKYFR